MIENNPPGQLPYVLKWKMKEAGFLILTSMNDGSYLVMWLPSVTDKEDKRCCRFNWRKERAVNSIKLGIAGDLLGKECR